MPAFLIKFFAPTAPYLAAAFLILVSSSYVVHLRHALTQASLANAVLAQTNQANLAAIAAYQAQSAKWTAAIDALGAETLSRDHGTGQIDERIDAQPAGADAPVAPVLAAALADIAQLQAGGR